MLVGTNNIETVKFIDKHKQLPEKNQDVIIFFKDGTFSVGHRTGEYPEWKSHFNGYVVDSWVVGWSEIYVPPVPKSKGVKK